jgi:hypothetical protein
LWSRNRLFGLRFSDHGLSRRSCAIDGLLSGLTDMVQAFRFR